MIAMVLHAPHQQLIQTERPTPVPSAGELLLGVEACGVCRTDLHVVDGELPQARYPVVPGHEIVGIVQATGPGTTGHRLGDRVGVAWLASTCGACPYCQAHRENLCDQAQFTGCTGDGGYATHAIARAAYCVRLDSRWQVPVETAPLLCAGLIGWRALNAAGDVARSLGIYGFGAAAHIVTQLAGWQGRRVFAFTRPGDRATQDFARSLGAVWAGGTDEVAPEQLHAAIIFAPAGELVPLALRAVRKAGRVVCAGIHMSDIPSFPYRWLWEERELVSVANLPREDARGFFEQAASAGIRTHVAKYSLNQANLALEALREGRVEGAAVLVP